MLGVKVPTPGPSRSYTFPAEPPDWGSVSSHWASDVSGSPGCFGGGPGVLPDAPDYALVLTIVRTTWLPPVLS
jgi:hypothetical protein